ncbi:uncharacterized protein LOC134752214 [Cydia strobilella]|uniref:uncharacterized protein LOC134752214 n=1 Tax=Cydia strobilella TaxID=1100964 RepID=UPI00300617F6
MDFGYCRFCETQGEHTNMVSELVLRGGQENYFDMLLDCFNVFLATDSTISSLICTTCAQRLRDAREFKQLVLRAQSGVRRAAATLKDGRPGRYLKIKPEPEDPTEPEDPGPDPLRISGVVVKSEPDIDIVEHSVTRTEYKSGFREDGSTGIHRHGQPEPKKQRLENHGSGKTDSILTGLSNCIQEPAEQETQNGTTKRKRKRKLYTHSQLNKALEQISQGMTIYQASKNYNIPETTLRDKRDRRYKNPKCGVQPILSVQDETQIVDWIHYLDSSGVPVNKKRLLDIVSKFAKNLNRPNPFKDGVPGRCWFKNFMKRHPSVAEMVIQNNTSRVVRKK